jgi:hypothetical protein
MATRQVPAACLSSPALNSIRASFSAAAKVDAETSGPAGGAVANAEGAPGGALDGEVGTSSAFAVPPRVAASVASTPSEVWVKNSLRDFFILDFLKRCDH